MYGSTPQPTGTPWAWSRLNPFDLVGMPGALPASSAVSSVPGIARSQGPGMFDDVKQWHPDSPMFWVGALLLGTFGLVASTTTIRVGPFKAGASLGKKD